MPDDKTLEELAKELAGAAIAGGTALAAGKGSLEASAAAGLALIPFLFGKSIPGYLRRKERDAQEWWDRVVWDNGTDTAAAAQIAARAEDPEAQDVIVAGFRSVLELSSRAAIPALAMLTREYVREGKPADRFFRAFTRLTGDLGHAEYAELRKLVAWLSSVAPSGRISVVISGLKRGTDMGKGVAGTPSYIAVPWNETDEWTTAGFSLRFGFDLVMLLKQYGFAVESPAGGFGQTAGPDRFDADVPTLAHVAKLLL